MINKLIGCGLLVGLALLNFSEFMHINSEKLRFIFILIKKFSRNLQSNLIMYGKFLIYTKPVWEVQLSSSPLIAREGPVVGHK